MTFDAREQRLLDCHAAWVHGHLTFADLIAEVHALYPDTADSAKQRGQTIGAAAAMLAKASGVTIERLAAQALGYAGRP